jgi:hypothetical protein
LYFSFKKNITQQYTLQIKSLEHLQEKEESVQFSISKILVSKLMGGERMVVVGNDVIGGIRMRMKENKTWATLFSKSQSLVSSLFVNLLISFSRLWYWFQQLYICWVVSNKKQEKESLNINFDQEKKNDENNIINNALFEINNDAEGEQKELDKMTIEVSTVSDSVIMSNPDHQEVENVTETDEATIVHAKFSLPIALRLNSEEVSSDQDDEDLSLHEFNNNQKLRQIEDRDSCSGYCSGSGSSLPGSPIPSSNLKQLHNNHQNNSNNNLSSADEHEENLDGLPDSTPVVRRDSDSSTASEDIEVSPEVLSRIVSQVEAMFSDDHLSKDGFLLKHVRRRSDGFVSLKLVAGLRKVKQISREFPVVLNALKTSDSLEVNTEGTKIRRKEPLTSELKAMPIKQAKKEKTGPGGDKEKNQAEKENLSDEQIARKRRQTKGDRLNELHFERGTYQQHYGQQNQYYKNTNSGRSSISSINDDAPLRRRGGSLPITALSQHRGSTAGNYLYPNASPPNSASGFLRPKSNSYSEGTDPSAATMSSWLQKRKASAASTRLSTGEISLNGVSRQPRGPDGTKGFHSGYRTLIIEERLQREMIQQLNSFSA